LKNEGLVSSKHNISGKTFDTDICDGFRSYFQGNYVNFWSGGLAFMNLHSVMDDILHEFDVCNCTMFTNKDIINAVQKLALGKSCGIDGVPGEAIKYCHPSIISKVQILFSSCCKHAFVPHHFCSGKITPVPKKNGVCSKSEDFRPVTIVNVLEVI
jgi:hypothetical protein